MREPGRGRHDPLGGEQGPVLDEDLAFIMDHLGVYQQVESAGLDTLTRLEAQGLDIGRAQRQLDYFERVLQAGGDPDSLIRIRRNFNDRMVRDAENL